MGMLWQLPSDETFIRCCMASESNILGNGGREELSYFNFKQQEPEYSES